MKTTSKFARPFQVLFLKVFLHAEYPATSAVSIEKGERGYSCDFIPPIARYSTFDAKQLQRPCQIFVVPDFRVLRFPPPLYK
jgi:hypothetical protein